MKKLYILFVSVLLIAACDNDLEQIPTNIADANSLTDFAGVLNAAYYYQQAATTPMAIMGDFRADNMLMEEEPYPSFDRFDSDLAGGDLVGQFFGPFYTNLYKAILSANNVIENSSDPIEIGEAQFLRALSYFKLVQVFGDVSVILTKAPNLVDIPNVDLARKSASSVYSDVIIPDFEDAITALDNSGNSRASKIAAQAFLGKVHMHMGNFGSAETQLAAVIDGAAAAGVSLQEDFEDIFGANNDLNSEILFATQLSTSINDGYGFTLFAGWYSAGDTKSLLPLDPDLIAAFDAVASDTLDGGDIRREVTISEELSRGEKWSVYEDDLLDRNAMLEQDWIELRLADVILLYAEARNEEGASPTEALGLLDDIRNRAGLNSLDPATLNTQALVRQAIADERRLELAFEGQRWFDLVRTGTAQAEMGETFSDDYYVFPIPNSEVLASNGAIDQNDGYN